MYILLYSRYVERFFNLRFLFFSVGHSDSESSDASFEIVSAEGIDDYQNSASSFKPSVSLVLAS